MKNKIVILVLTALLSHGFNHAQTSMPVPYGSFEQWTSHSGYSVTVGFIPMSVYDSYSTPTGWDYLAYPVNESISMGITTVNINTMLPLIVASQETGTVPHGNKSVKLQTFMLSDIVNSTVYSLASGYLDSTLINTVYPSILSTGEVDIDHFIPIMNSLIANMDSAMAMLAEMASIDVNYIISGGIPLNGFEPTSLTGYYKYHSAVNGDNGGVVILGTHYNSTLHKREVVGGGVNIDLTDCSGYTPFTVDYLSLHDYDATYAEQTPDSLIILLVSSASLNRQQGSYLCIDSLTLCHVDPPTPPEPVEPDTCARITSITMDSNAIRLTSNQLIAGYVAQWQSSFAPQAWEVEYGLEGFTEGNGITATVFTPAYTFAPLQPESQYELRVRTLCDDTLYGDWEVLLFQTMSLPVPPEPIETDTCARITSIAIDSNAISLTVDTLVAGYVASWQSSFAPQAWEVEYGFEGFAEGSGVSATVLSPTYSFDPLLPESRYELRVRALCNDTLYGDWERLAFSTMDTTTTITGIDNSQLSTLNSQLSISPNPAHGHCVVNLPDDAELRLYSSDGRLVQNAVSPGTPVTLWMPSPGVFLLQIITPDGTLTRKIVNR